MLLELSVYVSTALIAAVDMGQSACLQLLLEAKANINVTRRNGGKALSIVRANRLNNIVNILLKAKDRALLVTFDVQRGPDFTLIPVPT